ncbi:hypothetical protein VTI74DRAFT_8106 [Chaetomium olivicolor]
MVNLNQQAVPTHLAQHEDDDPAEHRGYVKGTEYALPYFSQWSRLHEAEVQGGLLRHVNCGYLSTHGVPPTLLALKQHAQSLCMLIHALNPTPRSAEIVGGVPAKEGKRKRQAEVDPDPLAFKYEVNDAFDFLNDLNVPYTNDDPDHNKPLTALINEVRDRREAHGTTCHCPFAEHKTRSKGEPQKMELKNLRLQVQMERVKEEVELLKTQCAMLGRARDALMLAEREEKRKLAEKVHRERERAVSAERELEKVRREVEEAAEREDKLIEELEALQWEVVEGGGRRPPAETV